MERPPLGSATRDVTDPAVPGFLELWMSDGDAVRRVTEGDPQAFAVLVERYHAGCLRYAVRMLGTREDAEEAVQDAFLRAYRGLGRYDHRDRFRAWLFRILVNRCRTRAVRMKRTGSPLISLDELAERPAPQRGPGDPLERRRIHEALLALPPDQREAFLLKHVEEMSYEEMAEATGDGVSALKMRVKRARDAMQRRLDHVD
jgi:RNA polymerase sigma-70 factor (ECF subfamily)